MFKGKIVELFIIFFPECFTQPFNRIHLFDTKIFYLLLSKKYHFKLFCR